MLKFQKAVSKGSRFNQIYVPKELESFIEAGDEVEVRLLRKRVHLHYSKGQGKLSEFKENLARDVFSSLAGVTGLKLAFIVGSFLTEKANYNDIDIMLVVSDSTAEQRAYDKLADKFDLKFHLAAIEEKQFGHLLKICPLTKSMLSHFVCSAPAKLESSSVIDENHLKFLMMMPRDLLHIRLSSRAFFDSLRRLVSIERFLLGKSPDTIQINHDLENLISSRMYTRVKNNEEIELVSVNFLRGIIKVKLAKIEKMIKWAKTKTRRN